MNEELKTTVIHEIGHYVAFSLINKMFSTGECVKITIAKIEEKEVIKYHGLAEAEIDDDTKDHDKNLKLFSQRCAGLIYGCIFQCLYLKVEFESCFGFFNNGGNDYREYQSLIPEEFDTAKRRELYDYFSKYYFFYLKSKREEFEVVFNLNFESLISEDENGFTIDIKLLKEKLEAFLIEHEEDFKKLIIKIEEIITK